MTYSEAVKSKWRKNPNLYAQAIRALHSKRCLVCASILLIPIKRQFGLGPFLAHCNHCGSEIPIAAMLNQKAWRITAKIRFSKLS